MCLVTEAKASVPQQKLATLYPTWGDHALWASEDIQWLFMMTPWWPQYRGWWPHSMHMRYLPATCCLFCSSSSIRRFQLVIPCQMVDRDKCHPLLHPSFPYLKNKDTRQSERHRHSASWRRGQAHLCKGLLPWALSQGGDASWQRRLGGFVLSSDAAVWTRVGTPKPDWATMFGSDFSHILFSNHLKF